MKKYYSSSFGWHQTREEDFKVMRGTSMVKVALLFQNNKILGQLLEINTNVSFELDFFSWNLPLLLQTLKSKVFKWCVQKKNLNRS